MATAQLATPEPFDFTNPDSWTRWKRRFEQYRTASGLTGSPALRQVTTLLYCMGDEANDVLATTGITEEEKKVYDTVITKLDDYFKERRNVIFDRAKFNTRCQQPGESADHFIAALYTLAVDCNYGDLKEELIRDRIVVGVRDAKLSERLQMDSSLSLEKAKKAVRQAELVQQQKTTTRSTDAEPLSVDAMKKKNQPRTPRQKQKTCTRCGKGPHPLLDCPAKDVVCRKCRRRGHYAAFCFSRTKVDVIDANDSEKNTTPGKPEEDDGGSDSSGYILDAVGEDTNRRCWKAQIYVNQEQVTFKLDTGAEVSAISDKVCRKMRQVLKPPEKILYGPGRTPLKVLGQFKAELACGDKSTIQRVFVIDGLRNNLLGLPAITALDLAVQVMSTESTTLNLPSEVVQFPSLFQGLGDMGDPYVIKLVSDAVPYALYTPRKVPLPLRKKVKQELERMESIGVISRVDQPSPWCAGMVVVPKKNGTVRVCVDLRPLNENVMRETFPLPTVDDILGQLKGATIFSKLDANSGFWQIPLAPESRPLTTFITPFGRFQFNKLPFGIRSAPEVYQKRMSQILEGLDGVLCLIDDVLVFAATEKQHSARLQAALRRIQTAGVTLNLDKCLFNQSEIKYLGYVINKDGISPDPDKTAAIMNMSPPRNVSELRRFLGMVNQFSKFSPYLSELTHPLRQLLSPKNLWTWNETMDRAFSKIKKCLTESTVLVMYNQDALLKISADASSHSLGAVLLQKESTDWKPIVYASRSLSNAETRYAQIEKEALASTWACERFSNYILGKQVVLETDHKPLVPLLSSKSLDDLPPRILRFRLRLSRFDYEITFVPGKHLHTADVLSRTVTISDPEVAASDETELFAEAVVTALPATSDALNNYRAAQVNDPVCSQIINFCLKGWPNKHQISHVIRPYWDSREKISMVNDLLLYGSRIIVPTALQPDTVDKIHCGHLGIQKCLSRSKRSVWWPGMSQQIKTAVANCRECATLSVPSREPLITSTLPDYPWQKIGADIFHLGAASYLLVVDYFSRYPEVVKLSSTSSQAVISILKSLFSRHGIPQELRSDNGPQFDADEMSAFAKSYGFKHTTSSPHYPQSNGQVERAVQTVKRLLKKASDPQLALLIYRTTPLIWCGLSPAELLMGRQLRSNLPLSTQQLTPDWSYLSEFRQQDEKYKTQQKLAFDQRHRARSLPPLPTDSPVIVRTRDRQTPGIVVADTPAPRSYMVQTPTGTLRRNRQHLVPLPPESSSPTLAPPPPEFSSPTNSEATTDTTPIGSPPCNNRTILPPPRSPIMTRTKTGTTIKPPDRLNL